MGTTLKDAEKDFISGGTNIEADPRAAKYIYELECDLTVVGAHTTINEEIRIHPQTVIYKKYTNQEVEHEGKKYLLVAFSELLAVIE